MKLDTDFVTVYYRTGKDLYQPQESEMCKMDFIASHGHFVHANVSLHPKGCQLFIEVVISDPLFSDMNFCEGYRGVSDVYSTTNILTISIVAFSRAYYEESFVRLELRSVISSEVPTLEVRNISERGGKVVVLYDLLLSVCLSVCLSACLSVCLSACVSVCLSVCLHT